MQLEQSAARAGVQMEMYVSRLRMCGTSDVTGSFVEVAEKSLATGCVICRLLGNKIPHRNRDIDDLRAGGLITQPNRLGSAVFHPDFSPSHCMRRHDATLPR